LRDIDEGEYVQAMCGVALLDREMNLASWVNDEVVR